MILDFAVFAALSQLRQARGQIERVGLCHVVVNKQRDLSRGHCGLIDLKAVIIGGEIEVGRSGVCSLALEHVVGICECQGEGNGLFRAGVRRILIDRVILPRGKAGVRDRISALGEGNRATRSVEERQIGLGKRNACAAVVGLGDGSDVADAFDLYRADGYFYGLSSGVIVALSAYNFVIDRVRSGIGGGGNGSTEAAARAQTVLHLAVLRAHAARLDEHLLIAVVGQGVCRRRGDRAGRDGGLGDGQLLFGALHRIAVLGGGEIDGVFSDRIEGVIFCILPTGIARLRQGDGRCFALLQNGERHIRAICIAAGAELDGRAALHLRRVAGQVLAIDLQIQGLESDGQAIDDNVIQLRIFDIIRGVPLVSAVRVEHLVSKCCVIQNRFPRRALCQRQFADHGGISRPGEFCTLVGNDLINAGCGGVLFVAESGGVAARSRLDRHRALDAVAVQIKSRVLRAADGIIAGHVGQQREFCAAVSVCINGRL